MRSYSDFYTNLVKIYLKKPENYFDTISEAELKSNFAFSDTDNWKNYIIDLSKDDLDFEVFSKDNLLYKYTPRIYLIHSGKTPIYYIERLLNRRISVCDFTEEIETAISDLNKISISALYTNNSDLAIIEESDDIFIKFMRFKFINV